jgi:hypothetical protein
LILRRPGVSPAQLFLEIDIGELLTKDEARRIAANIAKLPELFELPSDVRAMLFHKPGNDLANAKKLPPPIIGSLSRA